MKFWLKKNFGSKKFWVKKIFGSKIFLVQKNNCIIEKIEVNKFLGQNILDSKRFYVKKILGQKNIWVKKILGQIKFWVKKILGQKFLGHKDFGSNNILGQKNLVKKIWVRFFLSQKTGRVNPRGRIYGPPPQKIVGLKLCWVVLSFAW